MNKEKYLRLLSLKYPNIRAATSEIINLNAILRLPKGTEYFFSDIHGEYESFLDLLKSASGTIREKVKLLFENVMTEKEQEEFAKLVYYPREVLGQMEFLKTEYGYWERITIFRLVLLCRETSSKYTRSKVRKKLPIDYAYAIEELLNVNHEDQDKKVYYNEIIHSVIDSGAGKDFIIALCKLVQQLCVDKLHIIGDIFDRGPRADIIMNELMTFPDIDIQWGNHDISWMGAVCGNEACIANVLRIALSYNNYDLLEDGYGINLRALSIFASETYHSDPCSAFYPRLLDENKYDNVDTSLTAKMHKAITVIQLKLEGQLIKRHPEYNMDERDCLNKVDSKMRRVIVEGIEYPMIDMNFPTICWEHPLELSDGEKELINILRISFVHSELLNRHVKFLYSHGSMYKCVNSNLLYHGCIPMEEDGSFTKVQFKEEIYSGKPLFDFFNQQAQNAYFLPENDSDKQDAVDIMWYLWCGKNSPLFGKSKLAVFEKYFIADNSAAVEQYNPYYRLSNGARVCTKILEEFQLDIDKSHIINGHVPVKIKEGEHPVKAEGKLYVIDGGISKAYQSKTGIAGYTLIFTSHHLALAEHKIPSKGLSNLLGTKNDFQPVSPAIYITEKMPRRIMVADTDVGRELAERIEDLKMLVTAYKEGEIRESEIRGYD
ncbi:fructose-1,6-bisphosphatase [Anaeromicropila populeti]|uniref:Fructose-1,6-bisphosphatase class 3 n=1 Tax=Anaeromicropila populeti TaxID=37658 RepID=A0A1I6J2H2_9FIRM|nr:fructose-1,6-bisphosphatase [Anaeromicropila populeti]SFR73166.1 fructose-1,6-bisphosphatase-3 [Anaeromicropila populeti]